MKRRTFLKLTGLAISGVSVGVDAADVVWSPVKSIKVDMIWLDKAYHEKTGQPYICYGCGWVSSVKRIKPGQFLCNECLKIWEGGKFYLK